jgi:hypothetical protein
MNYILLPINPYSQWTFLSDQISSNDRSITNSLYRITILNQIYGSIVYLCNTYGSFSIDQRGKVCTCSACIPTDPWDWRWELEIDRDYHNVLLTWWSLSSAAAKLPVHVTRHVPRWCFRILWCDWMVGWKRERRHLLDVISQDDIRFQISRMSSHRRRHDRQPQLLVNNHLY